MPLIAGEKLAHYEILAPLGAGGMGEVYRARDTQLDRDAAIKVLPRAVSGDPDRLARFGREAKILAALNHPNIAILYGLVEAQDHSASVQRALAMELVPGETLLDRMKRGPIPLEEALPIARQIAEAVEAAHERGIIHRDLKPANVMITPAGIVKVLDFGLAAISQPNSSTPSDPANSPTITMGMTQAGVIMGTAAYMAPEQAAGTPVDKRADIWSFGVMLFEMLSGKRLFGGDTVAHTLADVLRAPIDFEKVTAPAALKNLLRRCLDRNISTRLRDIGEARVLLQNPIPDDPPPVAAAPAPARKPGFWPIAAMASLAFAAGTLAYPYFRPASVPEVTRFEIHAPRGTTLPLGTPAVSPDGRTIVFTAADKQLTPRLYVRTLDSLDARVLPGTENAAHPFFSPDGRSVAFSSGARTLMRIDLAGGAPRALADLTGPWHGSWNQNGTILFASAGLTQISANGGNPTPLMDAAFPFFLPDGKRFIGYVAPQAVKPEDKAHIDLLALGSKQRTLVLDDAGSAAIPTTVPSGAAYLLYMSSANVMAQPFDLSTGKLSGEPTAILDSVGRVANPALMPSLGVSPSGTLAFQQSGDQGEGHLTWYDRTGKSLAELASEAAGRGPVISPDGQFAAVLRTDASSLNEDIWVIDLKRGASSRLTFAKERDRVPFWSGDSKRITFNRDGVGIFEKDASGAGAEVLVLPEKGQFARSPDGRFLIRNEGAGKAALVTLPAGGAGDNHPIPVGSLNGRNANFEFSPDGKYIAYVSNETGRNQVYVQPTPPGTGRWQISADGGVAPHWRHDGKELFFFTGEELFAVDITLRDGSSISVGTPHSLFHMNITGGYTPSPDGQRFLVHTDQTTSADSPIIVVQNWWAALKK